jgi:hypothetical protein
MILRCKVERRESHHFLEKSEWTICEYTDFMLHIDHVHNIQMPYPGTVHGYLYISRHPT